MNSIEVILEVKTIKDLTFIVIESDPIVMTASNSLEHLMTVHVLSGIAVNTVESVADPDAPRVITRSVYPESRLAH